MSALMSSGGREWMSPRMVSSTQKKPTIMLTIQTAFQASFLPLRDAPPNVAFPFSLLTHTTLEVWRGEVLTSLRKQLPWGYLVPFFSAPHKHRAFTMPWFHFWWHLDQRSELGCGGRCCMHLGNDRGAPRAKRCRFRTFPSLQKVLLDSTALDYIASWENDYISFLSTESDSWTGPGLPF